MHGWFVQHRGGKGVAAVEGASFAMQHELMLRCRGCEGILPPRPLLAQVLPRTPLSLFLDTQEYFIFLSPARGRPRWGLAVPLRQQQLRIQGSMQQVRGSQDRRWAC